MKKSVYLCKPKEDKFTVLTISKKNQLLLKRKVDHFTDLWKEAFFTFFTLEKTLFLTESTLLLPLRFSQLNKALRFTF